MAAADPELLACLRLARAGNVGPRRHADLLRRHGSAVAAVAALERGGRDGEAALPPARAVEGEIAVLARLGGRFVFAGGGYPAMLAEIHDPPPVLATLGDTALFDRPAIAVVGSRNASASGRRLAESFARDLGRAGYVIVSGLARGIDTAAHRGAMDTGTIAVMAGGVDHVYPPENAELHATIAARGLVVSEQPMGLVPRAGHFPRRNRIAAGLALATLVVEATETSGALITARLAAEEGRDVFAVPGSPLEPRSRGCNRLIRDGAMLVESAEDIVDALALDIRSIPRASHAPAAESADPEGPEPAVDDAGDSLSRLVAALGAQPVEVDELVRRCQVTAAEVQILLLELELAGRLERHPGNRVSLVPT